MWLRVPKYFPSLILVRRVSVAISKPIRHESRTAKFPSECLEIYECMSENNQPFFILRLWGRYSSVGIATRYGLDGLVIEFGWERDFSAHVQTDPGAHPASYTVGIGSLPAVKRPGHGADHPTPTSAEVEGRVELYICSPSGPRGLLQGDLYLYSETL